MSDKIRLRSGRELPRTIADYDKHRPTLNKRALKAVCHAPFVSMDFDPTGRIALCNHSHSPVAQLTEDMSIIEIWRGEVYRRFREDMSNYVLDEVNCLHCVRQCEAGSGNHVFATEQFDGAAHSNPFPPYPTRLIFRLHNTCNLACIMCDGLTSSRIRAERDLLPPTPSAYGERFFKDMEEILPHVEHIEFYGGEPFLVKEHLRIFDLLVKLKAKCTIYVNTNGTSVSDRAKRYLEQLNFKTIAVSMDAVHDELHREVRIGIINKVFYKNFEYFMDLRRRRGVFLMLNVTEHRKNWFELPEVFRFAEDNGVYLHINTCIHPHNVTLYTLPPDQLRYVLSYLEDEREELLKEYSSFSNLDSFDFLLSLIRGELASRGPNWQPTLRNLNLSSDGLLAAPMPGLAPFHTAARVNREASRLKTMVDPQTSTRILQAMLGRIKTLPLDGDWGAMQRSLESLSGENPRDTFVEPELRFRQVRDVPSDTRALFREAPWLTLPPSIDVDDPRFPPGCLYPTEARLLFHLARDFFRGTGAIVDCGAFLGKSVALLAQGLMENPGFDADRSKKLLHTYDWFRVGGFHDVQFIQNTLGLKVTEGEDTRGIFDQQTAIWSELIQVHSGDFLAARWSAGEIEILFIDICKSPDVNSHLLTTMFPALAPKRSVVVQQDYHHLHHPVIHTSLELLADYIEPLATRIDDSFVFRLKDTIPETVLTAAANVQQLPPKRQIELMDAAIARLPPEERHFVRLARVVLISKLRGRGHGLAALRDLPKQVDDHDRRKWSNEVMAARQRVAET